VFRGGVIFLHHKKGRVAALCMRDRLTPLPFLSFLSFPLFPVILQTQDDDLMLLHEILWEPLPAPAPPTPCPLHPLPPRPPPQP
jgi:hypothetical protein